MWVKKVLRRLYLYKRKNDLPWQRKIVEFWRRRRDLNPRDGFLCRPTAFRERTLQPLGYFSNIFLNISPQKFSGNWRELMERTKHKFQFSKLHKPYYIKVLKVFSSKYNLLFRERTLQPLGYFSKSVQGILYTDLGYFAISY